MLIELIILWIVTILFCKVDIRALNRVVYIWVCLELIVNIVNMPDDKFHTNLLLRKLDLRTDKGDAFTLWQQRCDDYVQLLGLMTGHLALLCVCVSDDSIRVVLNLELPDAGRNVPKSWLRNWKDILTEPLMLWSNDAISICDASWMEKHSMSFWLTWENW